MSSQTFHAKRHRGGKKWQGDHRRGHHQAKDRDQKTKLSEDLLQTPIMQDFLNYQQELDGRHDKYERILKLSRDVTIESKRVIFLLHRHTSSTKEEILKEGSDKLKDICHQLWSQIALELQGEDQYRYLRAFSPGLQEYIEALSFLEYLKNGELIDLLSVQQSLTFTFGECKKQADAAEEQKTLHHRHGRHHGKEEMKKDGSKEDNSDKHVKENLSEEKQDIEKEEEEVKNETKTDDNGETVPCAEKVDEKDEEILKIFVPPTEYVLGLADLTGEIMRLTISCVGRGDVDVLNDHCMFMRSVHNAFVLLGNASRELPRKMHTLKQSLGKVEAASYTLRVRGSEIPKHMLTDVLTQNSEDNFEEII